MKLVFNGINSGLGNNGGSRTILIASQILESLGHRCDIIANVDNFKWFEHKPTIDFLPDDVDAIINIAAIDYATTRQLNVPIKAGWWRGHEIWANEEAYLGKCYRDVEVKNIVNSKGLKQLLATFDAESKVVYQGVDFDWWEDKKIRLNDKIRIGCLYNKKPTKRWEDFVKLAEILGTTDYEYVGIGDTYRDDEFLTYFFANANVKELNNIYSSCHIWFSPTVLEGLHNVPLEAALCGCLLVGNDSQKNGMIYDYLFDGKTGMVYPSENVHAAAELIKNPNWELVSKAEAFIKEHIGTKKDNMKKMIKTLETLI